MRSLGYTTSSSVFNLGTMLFLIISYILRLIVYAMVVNLVKVKSETTENYLKSEKKSLFYPNILLLILEGYFEFIISGYLNVCDISAYKTGLSGEVFSYILAWV